MLYVCWVICWLFLPSSLFFTLFFLDSLQRFCERRQKRIAICVLRLHHFIHQKLHRLVFCWRLAIRFLGGLLVTQRELIVLLDLNFLELFRLLGPLDLLTHQTYNSNRITYSDCRRYSTSF